MTSTPTITRDKILDAALGLFASQGFDGTAVPEVARAAGIATGSIYRHFASKEALVNALYRQWKGRLLAALQSDFPASATPRAQFAHLWAALVGFAEAAPAAFDFLETHYHAPYLDAASREVEASVMSFARQFAESAARAGAVRDLAPDLAIAVVFGIFVNVMRKLRDGSLSDCERCSAEAEACAWAAIKTT